MGIALLLRFAIGLCQLQHTFVQLFVQLLLGDTTNGSILRQYRYVNQIVQVAENAHLAEFGHARQESKTNVAVAGLQHSVECLQHATIGILQRFVANGLQQWLVILIHEDDHALAGLLKCVFDDMQESLFIRSISVFIAIAFLPLLQMAVQLGTQRRLVLVFAAVQVQMKDGMHRPFLFQLTHRQPFKKFLLAAKKGLESGEQQRLPETPRARKEIVFPLGNHLVSQSGLVDIDIAVPPDFAKVLYANGIFHNTNNSKLSTANS